MNVVLTESTNETNAAPRARAPREPTLSDTIGFGALLAGLHPVAQPSLDTPVLPESQMFDAPNREGDRRLQARDDTRSLPDQSDQSRIDVRARRAAAESSTQEVDPTPLKSSVSRGTSERAGAALPEQARRGVEHEGRSNRSSTEPAARGGEAPASKQSTAVGRIDTSQPVASAQRVAAESETRPVDGASNRAQNAARTLGRVLGAPQSTGIETGRATGAGQSAPNEGKTAGVKPATPSQAPEKQASTREATAESAFARMVRSLRTSPGSRNSSASIRLDPPRLGRMNVNVRMSGDRISIEVRTETMEARELVASRAMDLRSALEQRGLQIERFDVRGNLAEAGAADQPRGPRTDDRDREESLKRGSRRYAVESSSAASDRAPVPNEAEAADGDDTIASPAANSRSGGPEVAGAHRGHVDIRV